MRLSISGIPVKRAGALYCTETYPANIRATHEGRNANLLSLSPHRRVSELPAGFLVSGYYADVEEHSINSASGEQPFLEVSPHHRDIIDHCEDVGGEHIPADSRKRRRRSARVEGQPAITFVRNVLDDELRAVDSPFVNRRRPSTRSFIGGNLHHRDDVSRRCVVRVDYL